MPLFDRPYTVERTQSGNGLYVLVLYRLGFQPISQNLEDLIFGLARDFPQYSYVFHDVTWPLAPEWSEFEFDLIVLDVSFLCVRWLWPDDFQKIKSNYDFVRESNAVKVALPQDEYDCNELLDDWMVEWGVTAVFSCIPRHKQTLYPRYSKVGKIIPAFTGYIVDSLLNRAVLPIASRPIDIGYRARRLPAYFGRLGNTKSEIGLSLKSQAIKLGLRVDIEVGERHFVLGEAWYDFIANSKTMLGSNSGSSLLDPQGKIQREVTDFVLKNPDASFEEIEAACFPGLDGHFEFTAISPRVIEAALLGSCQILVSGDYSELLSPWEHYLPIDDKATDACEIFRLMADVELLQHYADRCRDKILSEPRLRRKSRSSDIVSLAYESKRLLSSSGRESQFRKLSRRVEATRSLRLAAGWAIESTKRRAIASVSSVPFLGRIAQRLWRVVRMRRAARGG
jgi:hypothetical protein